MGAGFDPVAYSLAKRALLRPVGVTALSGLTIDTDKDWAKRNIVNFGADGIDLHGMVTAHRTRHVLGGADEVLNLSNINTAIGFSVDAHASRHAAGGADAIPAGGIARSQLEYPTVDVNNFYLAAIGKLGFQYSTGNEYANLVTLDSFADKAVEGIMHDEGGAKSYVGRAGGFQNVYCNELNSGPTTLDHKLWKIVAGTATTLAAEAVDIVAYSWHYLRLQCVGSTISSTRETVTLSATDTSFTSGRWGQRLHGHYTYEYNRWRLWSLKAPASPQPKPIAYFEVPIVGSGTLEDPFRAKMPEEIVVDAKLGKRNLLALTNSALIPSDPKTGKPIHGTAIVRIFEQPDRDLTLHPIPKRLDALRAMSGVRELKREEAIALAKAMDDKLTDVDLIPIPATHPNFKTILSDYIAHREALGVKRELTDDKLMERYLTEEKGWG